MQLNNDGFQTLRKTKKVTSISRAKSLDNFQFAQLTAQQAKILLALPKEYTYNTLQSHILKQDILIKKHLFDPHKYFGSPQFLTYQDSAHFHQKRLNQMFCLSEVKTQRKNTSKMASKISQIKIQQNSPMKRNKANDTSSQANRRTVGRSPKSYVKENKQNFQKLNINNVQKVRLKLKIGKK